jgi:hypothetical protein
MGLIFDKSGRSHAGDATPRPHDADKRRRRSSGSSGNRIAYSSTIGHRRRIVASHPRLGLAARLLVLLILLIGCAVLFVAASALTAWLA